MGGKNTWQEEAFVEKETGTEDRVAKGPVRVEGKSERLSNIDTNN